MILRETRGIADARVRTPRRERAVRGSARARWIDGSYDRGLLADLARAGSSGGADRA